MKTEKSLWTSVSILIGAVIAVLAFVRGDILIWLLLGIFTLWGIWVVGFLLLPLIKRIKKNMLRLCVERRGEMDYKALYFGLFNRLTDLLTLLERQDYGAARELVIQLQQEAEDRFIEGR